MALLAANCGCLLQGRFPSKRIKLALTSPDAPRPPLHSRILRSRCQGQDSPGSAAEPPEEAPSVKGDWREFRASLINSEQAPSGGDVWSTRWCEENLHLLQQQDRKLAQEGLWAHETEVPEVGGLLIARPEGPELVGDARYWQLVIFLLEVGPRGARGVILNRPASAKVGDLLSWGYAAAGPGEDDGGDAARIQQAFSNSQVYLGGFYAPNRIARQPVMIMHGQGGLPDCLEILPGIYIGGEGPASREIVEGRMAESSFRFFAGQMVWELGQLAKELERGVWYTAACSRSLVLKQCLQLPVPLWKEILELMGGQYAQVARKRY